MGERLNTNSFIALVAFGAAVIAALSMPGGGLSHVTLADDIKPVAVKPVAGPDAADGEQLSAEQQRIADKYKHLEEVLLRMAELSASTDPQRAELLRKAVAQSKHCLIGVQFERLVELLEQGRLSRSLEGQTDLNRDLDQLLELLLSENRAKRIASEKARIRKYLKQLNRIIREQKALEGQTEGEGDLERLAKSQGKLSKKTGRMAGQMKRDSELGKPGGADAKEGKESDGQSGEKDGKPGKGEPSDGQGGKPSDGQGGKPSDGQGGKPSDGQSQKSPSGADSPAAERLKAARDKMKEAQEALEKAQREGAAERQEEALQHLEEAKAELEKILRQLREEEMMRMLAALQARFENMLKLQRVVYKGTLLLDKVPPAKRAHEHEIAAGRLSGKQSKIVLEADKALVLLKEDGTAIAFPEAVAQMREDMWEVAQRLGRKLTGLITQGVERDIMAALEEMIAILQDEIEELEENKGKDPPPGSMQQDPPLVDELAELKMIRALQMRVNRRTMRYSKLVDGQEARNADLQEALRRLAQREARIHEVTRKLDLEKPRKP